MTEHRKRSLTNQRSRFLPLLAALLVLGLALVSLNPRRASAASFLTTGTLVLYDAASGSIPSAPLMGFLGFPQDAALLTYIDGATVLDTTTAGRDTYAGWVATGAASPGFPILDRTEGFQVDFTLQVENESHAGNHRSGISFIVLGEDMRGIELAFWQDQIWAQGDDRTGGLFTRAESVAFGTGTLTSYQVTILGDTYSLTANGEQILTGPVRDYSAFNGFPDPYETPNFLFLGDDTTSAQARIRLSFVSITGTEPVVSTATGTITLTNTPLPTATFTPLPSTAPAASPTPAGAVRPLCPSGWIPLTMLLAAAAGSRKIRSGVNRMQSTIYKISRGR